jgi:hypothetical protein
MEVTFVKEPSPRTLLGMTALIAAKEDVGH